MAENRSGKPRLRATKAEIARRCDQVLRLLLDHALFQDVVDHAEAENWCVHPRTIRRYIDMANDLLAKQLENDRAKLIAQARGRRQVLYTRAVNAGDLAVAQRILTDEAQLLNLYPPKTTINANITSPWQPHLAKLTDEQLAAFIEQAERAAKPRLEIEAKPAIDVVPNGDQQNEPIGIGNASAANGVETRAVPAFIREVHEPLPDSQRDSGTGTVVDTVPALASTGTGSSDLPGPSAGDCAQGPPAGA